MVKRLFLGLIIGAIVGGAVAAAVINGLGWVMMPNVFVAYALAAATGALTGLFAGKPIWAKGGQIEAGLKAFFGALLAAGGMYAIRTWLHLNVDLAMLHAGAGPVSELPGAALPLIAGVLGGLYELDNTPEPKDAEGKKPKQRVGPNVRVADESEAEEEAAPAAAKKRSR
jgi:hypothetical protein